MGKEIYTKTSYYHLIRLLCRKVILNKMEPAPRLGREPTPDSLALTKSYFAAADSYALPKLAIPERKAGYELLASLLSNVTSKTPYSTRGSASTTLDVGLLTNSLYNTTSATSTASSRSYGSGVSAGDVVYTVLSGGSPGNYGR